MKTFYIRRVRDWTNLVQSLENTELQEPSEVVETILQQPTSILKNYETILNLVHCSILDLHRIFYIYSLLLFLIFF